jgi:5-methylcytosine-specific restriction endonuclease McrA
MEMSISRKEWQRKWRATHPERVKTYGEKARIRADEYYRTHKEHVLGYQRTRYEANAGVIKAKVSAYRKSHPEKDRDHTRKRRARKRNVIGGHFTEAQFVELCEHYGNKCLDCGDDNARLYPDHVIPLGPPHSDEISNIQPLCQPCNSRKHTKTADYRGESYTAGL